MKTKKFTPFILSIMLAMITSCTINKYYTTNNYEYDDVYSNPKTSKVVPQNNPANTPSTTYNNEPSRPNQSYDQNADYNTQNNTNYAPQSSTETYTDKNGNTYITNNYYYGDYYDYEYSARLKRFYSDVYFDYFDPFYTNLYWYTFDPYYFGISIYYTSWWWYRPHHHWYWGWGWYYPYYHYYGWGYPSGYYWGWQHGYWDGYYNGYWNGYHDGYWDGYYDALYGTSYYYYNSYDLYSSNPVYHGPRENHTGGSYLKPSSASQGGNTGKFSSFGERYEQAIARGEITNTYGISASKFVNRPVTQTSSSTDLPTNSSINKPSSLQINTQNNVSRPIQNVEQNSIKPIESPANSNFNDKPREENPSLNRPNNATQRPFPTPSNNNPTQNESHILPATTTTKPQEITPSITRPSPSSAPSYNRPTNETYKPSSYYEPSYEPRRNTTPDSRNENSSDFQNKPTRLSSTPSYQPRSNQSPTPSYTPPSYNRPQQRNEYSRPSTPRESSNLNYNPRPSYNHNARPSPSSSSNSSFHRSGSRPNTSSRSFNSGSPTHHR